MTKSKRTVGEGRLYSEPRSGELDTTAEELRYGQIVLVTARWVLIVVGLMLLMWRPAGLTAFTFGILGLLALAGVNFFLHVQILRDQPAARTGVYGMSVADLVVISLICITRGGFDADTYLFFYPAVIVYSLVFPGEMTLKLTVGLMVVYGLICLGTEGVSFDNVANQQVLAMRLLMIAAVSYLAYWYRRVERRRVEELKDSKA